MGPVIGITTAHIEEEIKTYPRQFYVQAVLKAGGIPLLIPVAPGEHATYLQLIDGLILSGGGDVDPIYFKQEPVPGIGQVLPERDEWELCLATEALAQDLPILGICRGIQVLNIAAGGNIYQDIQGQPGIFEHNQKVPRSRPWHEVEVYAGSRLKAILDAQRLRVNSFHHQAIDKVAPDFTISARAKDGIVEAIEGKDKKFAIGVQWHPEAMIEEDPKELALFKALVNICQKSRNMSKY